MSRGVEVSELKAEEEERLRFEAEQRSGGVCVMKLKLVPAPG
jgi:hypothetical protein